MQRAPPPVHPTRPQAYNSLSLPQWQYIFESYDAGITRMPVEVRLPYMDLRVMRYLLAVPQIPWCTDKHLLRTAFHGILPEAVRCRCKTPLMGDPVLKLWRETAMALPGNFHPGPELTQYVVAEAIQGPDAMWVNLRPHSLNLWLQYSLRAQTPKANAS